MLQIQTSRSLCPASDAKAAAQLCGQKRLPKVMAAQN
jgi:hypothetical protein